MAGWGGSTDVPGGVKTAMRQEFEVTTPYISVAGATETIVGAFRIPNGKKLEVWACLTLNDGAVSSEVAVVDFTGGSGDICRRGIDGGANIHNLSPDQNPLATYTNNTGFGQEIILVVKNLHATVARSIAGYFKLVIV